MIYKQFKDISLSSLGLGCMRLPVKNGNNNEIDEEKTAEMIDYALKSGVNYFDTAYVYHGKTSESVVGRILSAYPRESYYLATKFPGFDNDTMGKVGEIFEEQLEKTGAGYFDFYLLHNVTERNIDGYLNPEYGVIDYLLEQKKQGRIKHLGFSAHGKYETVKRLLDERGDVLEFCQIQLNWLDWDYQQASERVKLLNERNIPIWVMEPLRGGKLASLPGKFSEKLRALRDISDVEWSFRFLQSIPGVTMILSGMSNMDQLMDNIGIFEKSEPTTAGENGVLFEIGHELMHSVPCTACRYCTEGCPMGIDIPELIKLYNLFRFEGSRDASFYLGRLENGPENCIGCGACREICPQNIAIPDIMSELAEMKK